MAFVPAGKSKIGLDITSCTDDPARGCADYGRKHRWRVINKYKIKNNEHFILNVSNFKPFYFYISKEEQEEIDNNNIHEWEECLPKQSKINKILILKLNDNAVEGIARDNGRLS